MSCGVDEIPYPRISRSDDQFYAPVGFILCAEPIERYLQVAIVHGFHPVVVQLEVPEQALRHLGFDDQRLVGGQPPVALQIENVGIAAAAYEEFLQRAV